ncbi:MAG: hypothetical protein KKA42_05900 [candidate division Zixibacteria bacterium]|nr:hypothetical protein [candidate division Zixibacteria bacterium]
MSKSSSSIRARRILLATRVGFVTLLVAVGACLIWADPLIGTVAIAGSAAALYLIVRWQHGRVAYRCRRCSHEFRITKTIEFVSPHTPDSKLLRCPSCSEVNWCAALTVDDVSRPVGR